jgi:hypothetical protein
MAAAGTSTLGVLGGYGLEATAGTKPTAFTLLTRLNAIGGINLDVEQIDASALEDMVSRYIQGRADTGGTFPITVNMTPETITEWQALIAAYTGRTEGHRMWFDIYFPQLNKSFFIVAQPPAQIPMPEVNQNELATMEMNLIIEEYVGVEAAIVPTA